MREETRHERVNSRHCAKKRDPKAGQRRQTKKGFAWIATSNGMQKERTRGVSNVEGRLMKTEKHADGGRHGRVGGHGKGAKKGVARKGKKTQGHSGFQTGLPRQY